MKGGRFALRRERADNFKTGRKPVERVCRPPGLDSGAPFIPIVKETGARMRFPNKWSTEISPRNWVAMIFLECLRLVAE